MIPNYQLLLKYNVNDFQVSETGWGEFEVQIKIHFNDLAEKPLTFYHVLKLFHSTSSGNVLMWSK